MKKIVKIILAVFIIAISMTACDRINIDEKINIRNDEKVIGNNIIENDEKTDANNGEKANSGERSSEEIETTDTEEVNNTEETFDDMPNEDELPVGGDYHECSHHLYGYHGEYISSIFNMTREQFQKKYQLEDAAEDAKYQYYLENKTTHMPECPLTIFTLMEELGLSKDDLKEDYEENLLYMQITQEHIDVLFTGDEELIEEVWCNTKNAIYHDGKCYCMYEIGRYDLETLSSEGIPGEKIGSLLLDEAYNGVLNNTLNYIEKHSQQKLHEVLGVPGYIFDSIDQLLNNRANVLLGYLTGSFDVNESRKNQIIKYKNFHNEIDSTLPNIILTEDDYDYMAKLVCSRHDPYFHGSLLLQLDILTVEERKRLTELQLEAEEKTLEYLRNNGGSLPQRCFLPLDEILIEFDISKEELEAAIIEKYGAVKYMVSQKQVDALYSGKKAEIEKVWGDSYTSVYVGGRSMCIWDILESDAQTLARLGAKGKEIAEMLEKYADYPAHAENIIAFINENTQQLLSQELNFTKENFEKIKIKTDKLAEQIKEEAAESSNEEVISFVAAIAAKLESFEVSASLDVIGKEEAELGVIGEKAERQGGEEEDIEGEGESTVTVENTEAQAPDEGTAQNIDEEAMADNQAA